MLSLAPLALAVAFAVGDSVGQRTMLKVASIQLNDVQAILHLTASTTSEKCSLCWTGPA
jgi:hypothetical protein